MKPSLEELERLVLDHQQAIPQESYWKNKKTDEIYFVDRIGINEANLELVVIYSPRHSIVRFVHPLKEWKEKFELEV